MREWTGSVVLVSLLFGCGPGPASTFQPTHPGAPDAGGAGIAADGSDPGLSDGGTMMTCPADCPMAEPAEGDPCDLWQQCEYGDGGLVECNRAYFCSLGGFQKRKFDTSVCAPGLAAACPSTRALATPGGSCAAEVRCPYTEGECDCTHGTWHCFPDNPQLGVAHCTFPRPRLGSTCSPQSDRCEYEPICQAEACSACGKWELTPFSFGGYGCSTNPATDGGATPDATSGPTDSGMGLEGGTPRDGGGKPDGQARRDSGPDGH